MVRIEEIAARYGQLHRQGSNYRMLCPFHDDHHPSMTIHVGQQFFKCHACGAGGDAIALVRQFEQCTFPEALQKLGVAAAASAGAAPKPPAAPPVVETTTRQEQDNEAFLCTLLPYASGHRELSPVYLDFGVGLAPHLSSGPWKKFAGRLVFPIRDEKKRLVGFAGRALETDSGDNHSPKYLNSSSREGFDKSRMLYGIDRARQAIAQTGKACIVEGYKDALAMHAAGWTHTVAVGGTAFTRAQQELLTACGARQFLLLFDGDQAGQNAAEKYKRENHHWPVRICPLPPGEDPDSLFRTLGRDSFRLFMAWTFLAHRPAERRLADFCLQHPQEAVRILAQLDADDMPLGDTEVAAMVENVSRGAPVPPPIASLLSSTPSDPALADACRLAYYEACLLEQTALLRRQIATTHPPADRAAAYATLRRRLDLLATLRRRLGRMVAGAV